MTHMEDPREALAAFLDEGETTTHLIQSGMSATILTKLDRQDLVEYLRRLAERLQANMDTREDDDILYVERRELPTGDSVTAAVLRVEVF